MAITIPLTQGYIALVDECDAHLASHKWYAWISKSGGVYAQRNVRNADGKQRTVTLHREALGLKPGEPPVDHINGDGLDCRRANMRIVSQRENMRNVGGPQANNSTGFLGVYRSGKRFGARIMVDGAMKYLGAFDTPAEANVARLAAERIFWGVQPRRAAAFAEVGAA